MNVEELTSRIGRAERELEFYQRTKLDLQGRRDTTTEEQYNLEMADLDRYIANVSQNIKNDQIQVSYQNATKEQAIVNQLNARNQIAATEEERNRETAQLAVVNYMLNNDIKNLPANLASNVQNNKEERNFDLSEFPAEALKDAYRKAAKEYQDNPAVLTELNALNEQVKKRQKHDRLKESFLHDEEGKVLINPNSNRPYPRYRKAEESEQDYESFLKTYYTDIIDFDQSLLESKTQVPLQIEDKGQVKSLQPISPVPQPLALEDKSQIKNNQPNLPTTQPLALEDKNHAKNPQLALGDKNSKNNTSGLPSPTPVPLLEDKGKTPEEKDLPPKKDELPKEKKGLINIINDLTNGLKIKKKTGKKYAASNIKVAKQFKNELRSGNYLYNIFHTATAVVKGIGMLIVKGAAKVTLSKDQKRNMEDLKNRINKMTSEEIETVFNEYRGNRVIQERFPNAINIMLNQKIEEYALNKLNHLNSNIEKGYQKVFQSYMLTEALDKKIKDSKTTAQEKATYQAQKAKLLSGKADLVGQIRSNYVEANQWISGGVHGFSEDMKAATTKLSCVGKRFTKDHDLDPELLQQEAALERMENKAIAEKNDEAALKAFVKMEQLLSSETEIKNSIFGKRSTGKKYYSPLAEKLDYRDDPFVKDVFTTVAVVGAGLSAMNAMRTHGAEANRVVADQQAEATRVNNTNDATMHTVNETGTNIAGKRQDFQEGMTAQSQMDMNNIGNTVERHALDESARTYGGWALNTPEYRQVDEAGHILSSDLYASTSEKIQNITGDYASGALSQADALQAISDVSKETQGALQGVIQNYMPVFNEYAQSHPQFDLTALNGAMQYMVAHPDAITNMNQGMVDVANMGDGLIGLTAEHMNAITSLPSDLQTTLLGAASATALAYRVASTTKASDRQGKYGNEITRMVEESMNMQAAPQPQKAAAR